MDEVPEVVVSSQLAAADGPRLAQQHLGIGVTDPAHDRRKAVRPQPFDRRPARTDIMDHRTFFVEGCSDNRNEVVWLDEYTVLVHKHRPIGIAIKDDAAIKPLIAHHGGKLLTRLGLKRIGAVMREASIRRIVQDDGIREKPPCQNARRTVTAVHGEPQPCMVATIRQQPVDVTVHQFRRGRPRHSLSPSANGYAVASAQRLHLLQPRIVSHRKTAFPRHLQSVVRWRIMRGRDHHAAVKIALDGEEVDHRRGGETNIGHVRSCRRQSPYERIAHRLGGRAAVTPHEPPSAANHLRQRPTDLFNGFEIKIDPERSSHIICLEESHDEDCTTNRSEKRLVWYNSASCRKKR